MITFICVLMRT